MQHWRMRIELEGDALGEPNWPAGVSVRTFTPDDANAVHSLLGHAYRHGGGAVAPFDAWLPQTTSDAEFDPEVWFLAESDGALAGAILCWTSAFVKDLAVHESWRRRGVGEALLRHTFRAFAARGAEAVELKVMADNTAAATLYERVGMRVVEQLQS